MNDLRVKLVARRVRYLRVQSALPIYEKHCFPLSACRRDIDLAGDARVGAAVAAFAADDRFTLSISPYLRIKAHAGLTIDRRTDNYKGGSEYNYRSEYVTKEGEQEFESLAYLNGHWMIYP